MDLSGRQISLTISLAIWIQSTNVTDGRTPVDSKDHTYAQHSAVKTTECRTNCLMASPPQLPWQISLFWIKLRVLQGIKIWLLATPSDHHLSSMGRGRGPP